MASVAIVITTELKDLPVGVAAGSFRFSILNGANAVVGSLVSTELSVLVPVDSVPAEGEVFTAVAELLDSNGNPIPAIPAISAPVTVLPAPVVQAAAPATLVATLQL